MIDNQCLHKLEDLLSHPKCSSKAWRCTQKNCPGQPQLASQHEEYVKHARTSWVELKNQIKLKQEKAANLQEEYRAYIDKAYQTKLKQLQQQKTKALKQIQQISRITHQNNTNFDTRQRLIRLLNHGRQDLKCCEIYKLAHISFSDEDIIHKLNQVVQSFRHNRGPILPNKSSSIYDNFCRNLKNQCQDRIKKIEQHYQQQLAKRVQARLNERVREQLNSNCFPMQHERKQITQQQSNSRAHTAKFQENRNVMRVQEVERNPYTKYNSWQPVNNYSHQLENGYLNDSSNLRKDVESSSSHPDIMKLEQQEIARNREQNRQTEQNVPDTPQFQHPNPEQTPPEIARNTAVALSQAGPRTNPIFPADINRSAANNQQLGYNDSSEQGEYREESPSQQEIMSKIYSKNYKKQ